MYPALQIHPPRQNHHPVASHNATTESSPIPGLCFFLDRSWGKGTKQYIRSCLFSYVKCCYHCSAFPNGIRCGPAYILFSCADCRLIGIYWIHRDCRRWCSCPFKVILFRLLPCRSHASSQLGPCSAAWFPGPARLSPARPQQSKASRHQDYTPPRLAWCGPSQTGDSRQPHWIASSRISI